MRDSSSNPRRITIDSTTSANQSARCAVNSDMRSRANHRSATARQRAAGVVRSAWHGVICSAGNLRAATGQCSARRVRCVVPRRSGYRCAATSQNTACRVRPCPGGTTCNRRTRSGQYARCRVLGDVRNRAGNRRSARL